MKLNGMRLIGNKRLALAGIHDIQMDLTNPCQVIIGTNGVGKSTILRELSFLPPASNDYLAGGGKFIEGEHLGIHYVAKSTVDEKENWKHSLIRLEVDGSETELNPGQTKSVQKQLVEEIMGVTEGLFDIFTGDVQFTQMTPQKRREWILSLSGSDLEYAMSVYKKTMGKVRDSKALIEHYSRRLATEIETEITEAELAALNTEVAEMTSTITALMLEHVPNLPESDALIQRIWECVNIIDEASLTLIMSDVRYPLSGTFDGKYETLVGNESALMELLQSTEKEVSALYKQADAIDQFLRRVNDAGGASVGDLERVVERSRDKIAASRASLHFGYQPNAMTCQRAIDKVRFQLFDAYSKIPHDFNREGYLKEMQHLQQHVPKLKGNLVVLEKMKLEAQQHLYHLDNIDAVDCEQCGNHFKPGADQARIAELTLRVQQCNEAIAKNSQDLDFSIDRQGVVNDAVHCWSFVQDTLTNLHLPIGAVTLLICKEGAMTQLDMLSTVIGQYDADLATCVEIDRMEQELTLTESVLASAKQLSLGQLELSGEQLTVIEARIQEALQAKNKCGADLKALRTFMQQWLHLLELRGTVKQAHHDLGASIHQYMTCIENEAISTSVGDHQLILADRRSKINQNDLKRSLIKELTEQRDAAISSHKVYEVIAQQLSPVNGLIARRIRSFIDEFIGQMNAFIEKVWTYRLEIQATGIESDDLNCKFPLVVEKDNFGDIGKLETPDIAKSSSSQTDIINFAFRLIVMMCKGLNDYPIFLDEVGIRMDETHRERFNSVLVSMLESEQFSQMFIVSHHIDMHGLFTQAKICVLNADNIVNLPVEYNTHVEIS